MDTHTTISSLRQCLSVLSDTPVNSYDSSILLSSLHEECTKVCLELARVKAAAGHPNSPEIARFLTLLARHDENYVREAEDFEVKCGALAADLRRVLETAGKSVEAGRFAVIAAELSKRFTIKSYVIDSLFKEIISLVTRATPTLREADNSDFFFSGWANVKFPDVAEFQPHLLEVRPRELRVTDKDKAAIRTFLLDSVTLSVSLAPQREILLDPLVRVREVAEGGASLELWTKAFARALN